MKALVSLISAMIFMASASHAAEAPSSISLRCETPWPTASTLVETKDDLVRMTVIFHYGPGRIPLRIDSLTPDDYPVMESDVSLLRQLDRELVLQWQSKDCVSNADGLFRCFQGAHAAPAGSAGLKLDSVSFFTTRVTEQQIFMSRERYHVELWLSVGGTVLRVRLPYEQKDCSFKPKAASDGGGGLHGPFLKL